MFKEVAIGFSRGAQLFPSRIIEWLDGEYSHCYWKFTTFDGMKFLYESHLSGGVQITPYEHLVDAIVKGVVEKIDEIKIDVDPNTLWANCIPLHGKSYDAVQIIAYFISIKFKRDVVRRFDDGKYTCNEFLISTGKNIVPQLKDVDYTFTPNKLRKLF